MRSTFPALHVTLYIPPSQTHVALVPFVAS
jgi:hypothetical protein